MNINTIIIILAFFTVLIGGAFGIAAVINWLIPGATWVGVPLGFLWGWTIAAIFDKKFR